MAYTPQTPTQQIARYMTWIVLATAAPAAHVRAELPQPKLAPLHVTADLNLGESQEVTLAGGKNITVKVLDLMEQRDSLRGGKTVKLLTIGASFSVNATRQLGDLANAAGDKLVFRKVIIAGSSLETHWIKVEQFEKNPADKAGLYENGRSLRKELESATWDFVTIQGSSFTAHNAESFRPFASELRDYVSKYAPGAELLLFQTWAYRKDDQRFRPGGHKLGEPASQTEMEKALSNACHTISRELGVRSIPVGEAFTMANSDPAWGFQPEASLPSVTFPDLPPQTHSLNKGYFWKADAAGVQTLTFDGRHAGTLGEYLAGCVWYEVLYHKSVVGNSFHPAEVSDEDATYLQNTAHRAVEQANARK